MTAARAPSAAVAHPRGPSPPGVGAGRSGRAGGADRGGRGYPPHFWESEVHRTASYEPRAMRAKFDSESLPGSK